MSKNPDKKSFFQEFKEFISRGNVLDLAVGVIIGGAFTAIVNSLVADIIMPIVGIITGGIDFASMSYSVDLGVEGLTPATINYGLFIQNIVNFLLTALVIFLVVKAANKAREKKEAAKKKAEEEAAAAAAAAAAPAEPSAEVKLLTEILEALKEKK